MAKTKIKLIADNDDVRVWDGWIRFATLQSLTFYHCDDLRRQLWISGEKISKLGEDIPFIVQYRFQTRNSHYINVVSSFRCVSLCVTVLFILFSLENFFFFVLFYPNNIEATIVICERCPLVFSPSISI